MENETANATIKLMNQDFVRLDRFDGANFTRWKDKLKFMLTALKIYYVLDPDLPPISQPSDKDTDEKRANVRSVRRMKSYVGDIFLIRYQTNCMISILWSHLLERFGMHWNSSIRQKGKVLKNYNL